MKRKATASSSTTTKTKQKNGSGGKFGSSSDEDLRRKSFKPDSAEDKVNGGSVVTKGSLYFAYMMVNFKAEQKINTYIGKSRNPVEKVSEHNAKKTKGAKSTKQAAGSWKIYMIVGPFPTKSASSKFRDEWKANSRGIPSRAKRGENLAHENDMKVWDTRVDDEAFKASEKKGKDA